MISVLFFLSEFCALRHVFAVGTDTAFQLQLVLEPQPWGNRRAIM